MLKCYHSAVKFSLFHSPDVGHPTWQIYALDCAPLSRLHFANLLPLKDSEVIVTVTMNTIKPNSILHAFGLCNYLNPSYSSVRKRQVWALSQYLSSTWACMWSSLETPITVQLIAVLRLLKRSERVSERERKNARSPSKRHKAHCCANLNQILRMC